MDSALSVLHDFSVHTRMSDAERTNVTKIAQRYLALHVRQVPCAMAYAYVASDYKALELRTYNPGLQAAYSNDTLETNTLIYICKNNLNEPKETEGGSYEAFLKSVLPRPAEEELWKTVARPDKWKELAYFLGSPAMVEAIYHYPKTEWSKADNAEVYAIRDRMKEYEKQRVSTTAKEIGLMIADIKLPADLILSPSLMVSNAPMEPFVEQFVETKTPVITMLESSLEQKPADIEQYRKALETFRKNTGLPVTVTTLRIAKQYLFALAGAPASASQVKETLGPFQKEIPLVERNKESAALATSLVDALSWQHFDPNHCERAKSIASVAMKNEWDPRELIKHVLCPEERLTTRELAKYQKLPKDVDMELLDAIGNLK